MHIALRKVGERVSLSLLHEIRMTRNALYCWWVKLATTAVSTKKCPDAVTFYLFSKDTVYITCILNANLDAFCEFFRAILFLGFAHFLDLLTNCLLHLILWYAIHKCLNILLSGLLQIVQCFFSHNLLCQYPWLVCWRSIRIQYFRTLWLNLRQPAVQPSAVRRDGHLMTLIFSLQTIVAFFILHCKRSCRVQPKLP